MRKVCAPTARVLLLPKVPAPYAGLYPLAAEGLIEFVQENITLWRAMSNAEATVMRAAQATGGKMTGQFARPLKVRTSDGWVAVLVRHFKYGSYEVRVFWTAASSSIAARLAPHRLHLLEGPG